jgi:hypothetical protein
MTTLAQHLTLGGPQLAGPLAVFPVFGPAPRLAYRSFAEAAALGALVKELDGTASVNDVTLGNPTNLPLLAYEGEEILGAQQNRTFDVSVLLDVQATARVPVSCVEQERWDGRRHGEAFSVSPQAADPTLRARKRAVANRRALVGMEARADQCEVWNDVSERLRDHGVDSESLAMSDLYDHKRKDIDSLVEPIAYVNGSIGSVAMVSGRPVALDLVSRPEVFCSLFPRLVQGYALDALEADDVEADPFEAERFLDAVAGAERRDLRTPGMGRGFRVDTNVVVGSGIEHGEELVQLCAFPAQQDEETPGLDNHTRIDAPSRRRRRR